MSVLIVVNNPKDWYMDIPGVQVVAGKKYLSDPHYSEMRGVKVFNLSRSYRYQSIGYYVSLLAEARGHKPLPSINTIQDMKLQTVARFVSDELDELIQKSLSTIRSEEFELSIYFGRSMAKRYERLAQHLFNLYPAPLLLAKFVYNTRWQLQSISPLATNDIPDDNRPFVIEAATLYFQGKISLTRRRRSPRYDLAILYNPAEVTPPSGMPALKRFVKVAEEVGFDAELITKDDLDRILEFDALFIRETTGVNHRTYRVARKATAEGLVVIDDPNSILKCTNKVYLAELLTRHNIPIPQSTIITKDNVEKIAKTLTLPAIIKQPDSAFSQGVIKVETVEGFLEQAGRMLDKSDLIIAQEFMPTPFDWRVGIIDRQPIFCCKYYMAGTHWQIIQREDGKITNEGNSEAVPLYLAPPKVIKTALSAANLIGKGLYGVDLKQVGKQVYVIEVNDNPNIDVGVEDAAEKNVVYETIMRAMFNWVEKRKGIKTAGK